MTPALTRATGSTRVARLVGLVAAGLIAVITPFVLGPSAVYNLTNVVVLGCAVTGLVLLTGFTRQVSLGHNFFFALGAYTTAWALSSSAAPYVVLPFASFVLSYAAGYAFGLPILRIRGTYLSLATMGLGLITPNLVRRLEPVTNGSMGIQVSPLTAPAGLGLAPDQWVYLVCVSFLALIMVTASWIANGQVGRAMKALGDNEIAASLSGIDIRSGKSAAFAWSGGFAGVSGALFVLLTGYISPGSVGLFLGLYLLAALVIGGQRAIAGAVLGAAFIIYVPLETQQISESLSGATFGLLVVVFMLLLPEGITSSLHAASEQRWRISRSRLNFIRFTTSKEK